MASQSLGSCAGCGAVVVIESPRVFRGCGCPAGTGVVARVVASLRGRGGLAVQ